MNSKTKFYLSYLLCNSIKLERWFIC